MMDAPPVVGVLEALEALAVEELSAAQLGRAMRASGKARGRLDVVDARFLAAFDRMGGHRPDGATDTSSWLASATKLSGRDAKRALRRAKVLEALPALGDKLAAGEVSAAHVDALAAVLPAKLVPTAGDLVGRRGR